MWITKLCLKHGLELILTKYPTSDELWFAKISKDGYRVGFKRETADKWCKLLYGVGSDSRAALEDLEKEILREGVRYLSLTDLASQETTYTRLRGIK